jgi:hypothetical protein
MCVFIAGAHHTVVVSRRIARRTHVNKLSHIPLASLANVFALHVNVKSCYQERLTTAERLELHLPTLPVQYATLDRLCLTTSTTRARHDKRKYQDISFQSSA